MQAAFRDNHGLQCGYCTPGMIMTSIDIVARHGGDLDEATVRQELEGNICRCTGYHNIVKAGPDAPGQMKGAPAAEKTAFGQIAPFQSPRFSRREKVPSGRT